MSNKGWECPKCGMVYGPRVVSCAPCNMTLAWMQTSDEPDVAADVGIFLRDCCIPCVDASITATDLYEAYCIWSDVNGWAAFDLPSFGRALIGQKGIDRQKIAGRVRYMGLRLRGVNAD